MGGHLAGGPTMTTIALVLIQGLPYCANWSSGISNTCCPADASLPILEAFAHSELLEALEQQVCGLEALRGLAIVVPQTYLMASVFHTLLATFCCFWLVIVGDPFCHCM